MGCSQDRYDLTLGTIHSDSNAASFEDYGLQKPDASVHSHPDVSIDSRLEIESMGKWIDDNGSVKALGDWSKARRGNSPSFNYVYFPNSSRLYKFERREPIYIRTIKSFRGFFFGALNKTDK